MVRRRRNTGGDSNRRKSQPKRNSRKPKDPTLKERVLTTAIWGLSVINIALIFSLVSNFFSSENEVPVSANLQSEQTTERADQRVTVEVLNACGVQGLANDVRQYLRNNNFDVVNVGNYSSWDLDQTLIFDRVSVNRKYAEQVADVLDVNQGQVVPELDESLQLMVTVIIGKDYRRLRLFSSR